MMEKIILDTDIGTDIDDAVCLAYLLANPQCDLLGITTVTGEAVQRAQMASVVCRAAGRDIPIFPGAEHPLIVPQKQTVAQQAAVLHRWDHQQDFPSGAAIEFLRQTIRKNPGEVTLLAIGPLTNIGLLFAVDPEIPGLLKGLVMMAGYFFQKLSVPNRVEWNASGDPHASALVYRSGVRIHRSIGLDVTTQVVMTKQEIMEKFRADLFKPVLDFAEIWFEQHSPSITFHDPLAAAAIFDDQVCNWQAGRVEIELHEKTNLGYTHWQAGEPAMHQVAMSVDTARFFQHYFSVFQ